jgi:hypothetical protein
MILDADLLARTLAHAEAFLAGLPERHVGARADPDGLRIALTDGGVPAATVIDELVAAADPGLVASAAASRSSTTSSSPGAGVERAAAAILTE